MERMGSGKNDAGGAALTRTGAAPARLDAALTRVDAAGGCTIGAATAHPSPAGQYSAS